MPECEAIWLRVWAGIRLSHGNGGGSGEDGGIETNHPAAEMGLCRGMIGLGGGLCLMKGR